MMTAFTNPKGGGGAGGREFFEQRRAIFGKDWFEKSPLSFRAV